MFIVSDPAAMIRTAARGGGEFAQECVRSLS